MATTKERLIGTIVILALIVALAVIVVVLVNKNPKLEQQSGSLDERIAVAKAALEEGVRSNRDIDHPYIREHLVPAFERGISLLSARPPPMLKDPVLLLAAFEEAEPSGYRLFLLWLEDGFSTSGIAVVEDDDKVLTEKNVFEFSGEDRRRLGATVWRSTAVRVLLGEGATTQESQAQPGFCPPIQLPKDAFNRELRVSLTTQDGKRTESLRAYIAPALKSE